MLSISTLGNLFAIIRNISKYLWNLALKWQSAIKKHKIVIFHKMFKIWMKLNGRTCNCVRFTESMMRMIAQFMPFVLHAWKNDIILYLPADDTCYYQSESLVANVNY